ncbi:MAG: hypothetical protein AAFX05_08625 [Planctomycetota bacterium]
MRKHTPMILVAGALGALAVLLGLGASASGDQFEYAVMSVGGQNVTLITGERIETLPAVSWNRTGGDDARRQRALTHLNNLGAEGWQVVSTSGTLVNGRVFLQRRR